MTQRSLQRSLLLAVLGLSLLAAVPPQARAGSCTPLLTDLYNYVANNGGYIGFLHTTNYQAHGYWATAHAWGYLVFSSGNGLMSGIAHRTWHDGHTDSFALSFYNNGTVWFGQYGPYTPTCDGTKFLLVDSGDSYEAITFTKGVVAQE
jgi:hypothetical protein